MASSVSGLLTGLGTNSGTTSSGTSSGSSTGIGQGINVASFVAAAETDQQTEITALQTQQTTLGEQTSALSGITADLTALQSSISALNDPLGVLSDEIATSSNSNAVTATATGFAVAGTHTIAITSLATTSSYYSDPVATGTTPLATGDTITISAGGTQVAAVAVGATNNTLAGIVAIINSQATSYQSGDVASGSTPLATGDVISILAGGNQVASVAVSSANNTLAQIATAINSQTNAVTASVITDASGARLSIVNTASNAPANLTVVGNLHLPDTTTIDFNQVVALQASVINDANGARLAIVSAASGTPGNLAITGSLHQTNAAPVNFTQASAGLNAVLSVDSVPISSATNSVSNVIPGVTLDLEGTTGDTPASLTVAPDTSSIGTAIGNFVTSYNTAITAINSQFQVSSSGSGVQSLEADSSLRDAQQQLLSAVTYSTSGNGGSINLTNLGISVNNDGTLSVDSAALNTALSSNFSGVQSFLQTASTGFAENFNAVLSNVNGPGTGELTLDAQGYTQQSAALGTQVTDLQSQLAVQTTNLTQVYAKVNATLEELPLLEEQLSQQLASVA